MVANWIDSWTKRRQSYEPHQPRRAGSRGWARALGAQGAQCRAANDSAVVDEQYRSYDRANRPLKIVRYVGPGVNTDSQAYDAHGQLLYQIQDGIRRDYTYDLSGNLLSDLNWSGPNRYGRIAVTDGAHNRLLRDSLVDQTGGYLRASYYYTAGGAPASIRVPPSGSIQPPVGRR